MSRRAVAGLVAMLAAVAGASLARAQAGVVLEDPAATPAGDRFFWVPDATVRGMLNGRAKLVLSYATKPLRTGNDDSLDDQLYGHLNLGAAFGDAALLGLDVPYALSQNGSSGLGDLRATARVHLLDFGAYRSPNFGPKQALAAGAQIELWIPTGDEQALAGDGGWRLRPAVVLSGQTGPVSYGMTLGYQLREQHQLAGVELGSGLTVGAAAGLVLLSESLQLGVEVVGSSPLPSDDFLAAAATPVEALVGGKWRLGDFVVGVGVAHGFGDAPGAPQLRTLVTVGWSADERVFDRDSDGVVDTRDACPVESGFGSNGCPLPDRDGDTIIDDRDACPDEAGLVHAEAAQSGCPSQSGAAGPP